MIQASKLSALFYSNPNQFLEDISKENTKCSYQRCLVAVFESKVVGVANLYPSEEYLLNEKALPKQTIHYLTPLFSFPLPQSLYISALAATKKGEGIGTKLLKKVEGLAEKSKRDLTLHCWNQNVSAMQFYQKHSFIQIQQFHLGPHPLIPYDGEISLLHKRLLTD